MKWLTPEDASEISGYHAETIRQACRGKELRASQRVKGGKWRIREDWLDAWLGAGAA